MSHKVVCAGEALIDLLTEDYAQRLDEGRAFLPFVGGSPANLASNLRTLGLDVNLVSAVGADAFGDKILADFAERGLPTESIERVQGYPTSLVLVTKSKGSPDFEVYRGADCQMSWAPFEQLLQAGGVALFHTTCFALSALPARSHLLRAAEAFAKTGAAISIDANYAHKVWPDRERAQKVLRDYCRAGALVKMSEVDYERLYERPLNIDSCAAEAQSLLSFGAKLVCFTFGSAGAIATTAAGQVRLDAPKLEIVDATGAGDSYWSGFLTAYLHGNDPLACLQAGNRVAAIKLQRQGPLRGQVDWR